MDFKVMRHHVRDFIATTAEPDKLYFCGKGFSKLDEESTPTTSSDAYISDKNASPSVDSYARKFSYEASVFMGADKKAVQMLMETSIMAHTGADAEFTYYRTEPALDADGKEDLIDIPCRKFTVANENSGSTGAALETLKTSGTLHQVGDFVWGTLSISDTGVATFTEATI